MKKFQYIMLAAVAVLVLASCEKVSPIGVLVSGTGVEDRVKMSVWHWRGGSCEDVAHLFSRTQGRL